MIDTLSSARHNAYIDGMIVIFDCDGTLVDSQHAIHAALRAAFMAESLIPPGPAIARGIVGLSLEPAMARLLAATGQEADPARLAQHYREAFLSLRRRQEAEPDFEPLFPGVREMLETLKAQEILLGIATGKSHRGLMATLERHGLRDIFTAWATADDHPSKPHPAMLEDVVAALGGAPEESVYVGDTRYDIEMARAAGTTPVGVSWGYHEPATLVEAGAAVLLDEPTDLPPLVQQWHRLRPLPDRGVIGNRNRPGDAG